MVFLQSFVSEWLAPQAAHVTVVDRKGVNGPRDELPQGGSAGKSGVWGLRLTPEIHPHDIALPRNDEGFPSHGDTTELDCLAGHRGLRCA
jgi:hypothetical protein